MPDVNQIASDLRGVPDQTLQMELQSPSGMVPSYLVLAEAQRRQTMRQAAQQQQSQGQSSTVLQDVVRNMMAQQPPPGIAPAGMTPPRQGSAPMPGAQTPNQMGMAKGGRFADGGEADDSEDSYPVSEMPTTFNLNDAVNNAATKYGLNPADLWGVVQTESRGNPGAVGPVTRSGEHAVGLMQLMPGTARLYGVTDRRDPLQSLDAGARYLRDLHQKYGDWDLTRAAYNAGPGAVDKYNGVPPFRETQQYLQRADKFAAQYAKMQPPGAQQDQSQLSDKPAQADTQQAAPQDGVVTIPKAETTPAVTPKDDAVPAGLAEPTPYEKASMVLNAMPNIQPPPAQAGQGDQGQPVFSTEVHQGRIHQMITDQQKIIDDLQRRLQPRSADNPNGLIDPYGDENIAAMKKIAPMLYGVTPDYLDNMSRQADTRAATINQLQGEILQRYHNPSPWEFLANLSAGMGASGSLNLAGAFGQGVGLAWQRRDQQQQQAMQDYDALEKMREGIYGQVENERGRMGQTLAGLLEHQAGITDANRKSLQDELNRATAQQDKLKQSLVPTNKFEAYFNQEDHTPEEINAAKQAWGQAHNMNAQRLQAETNAVGILAKLGDPFVPNGQFATAYDQVVQKHPEQAKALLAKPDKYSPDDIALLAKGVVAAPDTLYDPKVVPKDAVTAVRSYMAQNNMQTPVRPPNKTLHDMAASSQLTLDHVNRVRQIASDPWIVQNVLGPFMGRVAKGEEKIGMDEFPILKTATPQQTRDTQDLLTSLNYLFMREGRSLFGGRPPQMLMQHLLETSPSVNMGVSRFLGSMDGVEASAKMAVGRDRAYMFNANPISAIPPGARLAHTPDGRQVMQAAPGQPWYFMDNSDEEYKPPK